jgi:cobalt/nickel transport system permease protein
VKHRLALLGYLAFVLVVTSVHHVPVLIGTGVVLVALAGRNRWSIMKHTLVSVALFTGLVSLTYAAHAALAGLPVLEPVIRLNVRVFVLTYATLLMLSQVNLYVALSFSRSLSHLLCVTASQAQLLAQSYRDFRIALTSRSAGLPRRVDRLRQAKWAALHLFELSIAQGQERALAMRSRGMFLQ